MVEGEPPAQAPALEDPVGFEALGDDLVLRALVRAPFVTHGSLQAVNHRFKSILGSPAFLKQRVESGFVEHGLICAGGARRYRATAECWMLSSGGR